MPNMTRPMPKGPISSSAPPPFRPKKKMPGDPEPLNKGRLTGPPMQHGAGQGSMFANGGRAPQAKSPMGNSMQGPGGVRGQSQGGNPMTPNYPQPASRMVSGQPQGRAPMTPNYPMANGGKAPMGHMPMRKPFGGMAPGGKQMPGGMPQQMPGQMMADGGFGMPPAIGGGEPDQDDMAGAAPPDDQGGGQAPAGPLPVIKPEAVAYHDDPHACSGCSYFSQDGNCAVLQMQVNPAGGCNAFEAGGDQGAPDDQGGQPGDDMSGQDDQTSDGY